VAFHRDAQLTCLSLSNPCPRRLAPNFELRNPTRHPRPRLVTAPMRRGIQGMIQTQQTFVVFYNLKKNRIISALPRRSS
jgi:hypothetical protein